MYTLPHASSNGEDEGSEGEGEGEGEGVGVGRLFTSLPEKCLLTLVSAGINILG